MPAIDLLDDLRAALGSPDNAEDTQLERYLTAAQAAIEGPGPIGVEMAFEASADIIRRFDASRDVHGRTLMLDYPLCAITSVVNGDGTTIPSSAYVTEPRNRTPYYALTLKAAQGYVWTWNTDPENAIVITGKWAFATTFPANIEEAIIGLAKYYYQHRNQPTTDVQVSPELGTITIPRGIPAEVKAILSGYRTRY